MGVRVQSEPFDIGAEVNSFVAAARGAGAVVSFTGLVRDNGGTLTGLEIEHFPGMSVRALTEIHATAMARWSLQDALILHRYGQLQPDEAIMMVATAARHRSAAFEAAEFLMDYLKSRAPFWKKEHGATGTAWVTARTEDEDALDRWSR